MEEQIRIKDKRRGVFTVDNVVLNGYGKILGATGITFYITLCRYANNQTQKAFPSITTIYNETGMDRKTIIRCSLLCEELELVKREAKKGKYTIHTLLEPKSDYRRTHWWKNHTGQSSRDFPPTSGKNHYTGGKTTHERTKITNLDNELIINPPTPLKKGDSKIQEIVNFFFILKGWENKSKEYYLKNKIIYARYTKPAKDLLFLCDGDLEEAKKCLQKVSNWAKSRQLDWTIETLFKKWYEIDHLLPKEKKPFIDNKRAFQKYNRWYVILPSGEINEWVGSKKEIVWK